MMRKLSDITPELVARAAEGDGGAVEEIVRALQAPIYNVALRMLLDRRDAEDATQESLIRIFTHLSQFREEARFSTWAWRIAIRRILDFREQRAAAARYTFEGFAADLANGRDPDAAERVEDAVLHQQLKVHCSRAMLHCLDGDHRVAFVLGEILELSSREAAEILDIGAAAFRKRLSRARAALTAFLAQNCGVFNPAAPCGCHRRLDRALALGRVDPNDLEVDEGNLVTIRAHLSTLSELRRVAAYYRSEPELRSRRDFVATMRSMLAPYKEPS